MKKYKCFTSVDQININWDKILQMNYICMRMDKLDLPMLIKINVDQNEY